MVGMALRSSELVAVEESNAPTAFSRSYEEKMKIVPNVVPIVLDGL